MVSRLQGGFESQSKLSCRKTHHELGGSMKTLLRVMSVIIVLMIVFSAPGTALAGDSAVQLVPAINEASNVGAGQSTNYVFRNVTATFNYSGGPVCLSSQQSQCSPPAIDDAVRIYVDGREVYSHESRTQDFGPVDFSDKLHTGSNQVRVELIDLMGPSRGGSALWLVASSNSEPTPPPPPPAHTNTAFDRLQPGDIILSRNDDFYGKVEMLTYGGYWSHALIVTDIKNGVPYVAQSYADNLKTDRPGVVSGPLTESGTWIAFDTAIVRVKTSAENRNRAGNYALAQKGDPYNWKFWDKWTQDAFYCSQLDWAAFNYTSGIELDSDQSLTGMILRGLLLNKFFHIDGVNLAALLNDAIVTPDDLYHSPNVELVSIADKGQGRQFLRTVIWVFSPVDLYLTDPNGNSIGTNPVTGEEVNEIPGATYSGGASEPEFIVVQDLAGDWTLETSGTDKGQYSLVIEEADTQHSIVEAQGTTEIGVHAVYNLNVGIDSVPVLIPQDQTPPTTTITLDGMSGLNGWYITPVKVTLSALDNEGGVGVRSTEYSLDNGVSWLNYEEPFILNDGINQLLYRSIDHVNNVEDAQHVEIKVDTVPPVVNVWTDQTEYTRVQPFVVHYSGYDPEPGSGLASLTGEFNGQPVTNGQTVDMFWLDLGQYTLNVTGQDYAGWTTMENKSIQLVATIESLQQTVQRLCQEKYITKSGVCNSLLSKLDSALAAQKRGQNKTAVDILLALQNEIRAQTGKAIKPEASSILIMDSNYVIQRLGGK
jgi:hypothetical protein